LNPEGSFCSEKKQEKLANKTQEQIVPQDLFIGVSSERMVKELFIWDKPPQVRAIPSRQERHKSQQLH